MTSRLWVRSSWLLGLSFAPFVACGGGGGNLGADCDPSAASACGEELICSPAADEGHVCTLAPGADCDEGAKDTNGGCAADARCAVPAGSEEGAHAICLVSLGGTCDPEDPYCDDELTCAETTSGEHRCYGKVVMRGDVTDTSNAAAIEDARVLALDEEGYAVTDVAVTDIEGAYELEVPVVRDDEGHPIDTTFTLQGSAQNYEPFPRGARVALPISTADAEATGNLWVIEQALTSIGLVPLPEKERFVATGSLVGLDGDSNVGGALVVASGPNGTFSGITDKGGAFTLFNLLDGTYTVRVYADGMQVESLELTVEGANLDALTLNEVDEPTTTVTGSVQIVEGGGETSVILVVEDTFDEDAIRGEVPRGLRAPRSGRPSITGEFTIEGVPAGRYVVLAAYENDALVRDPDANISGTDIVHIEIPAGTETFDMPDSFKVTQALATLAPGVDGPEAVSDKPMLQWADDSSEDWYDVRVFDSFGEEVWNSLNLPSVSGGGVAEVQYGGPLEPGMYYQFRVSSWRDQGNGDASAIATTEDLRGVFFLPAP
ncbi:MAG TPA: carboxypeptidase-like regulatory domain-containing protein [Polyangiaceae bacterium]|nr:carboxypeptidase-like regulatory domain-containing protein [Polyangiaceae bacterium]